MGLVFPYLRDGKLSLHYHSPGPHVSMGTQVNPGLMTSVCNPTWPLGYTNLCCTADDSTPNARHDFTAQNIITNTLPGLHQNNDWLQNFGYSIHQMFGT